MGKGIGLLDQERGVVLRIEIGLAMLEMTLGHFRGDGFGQLHGTRHERVEQCLFHGDGIGKEPGLCDCLRPPL